MEPGQQLASPKIFARASPRQRLIAALVFLVIAAGFALVWLMGYFHITLYPFPCGFKQRYGLPCPTCGMTTAILAFAQGHIIRSFCIQPAAAFFCTLVIVAAFFALLIAVFGVYSPAFERRLASLKMRYIVAALVLILAVGWAVTLARALVQRGGY